MAYSDNLQAIMQCYASVGVAYHEHVEEKSRKGYDETTLVPLLGDLRSKTVLDVGSGTGRWSRVALQLGASNVYALEPSDVMDAVALEVEKQLHLKNIQHLRGDICGYDLGSLSVDVAIVGYVLHHLSSREYVLQGLQNVHSSLKAGGLLVGLNACFEETCAAKLSSSNLYAHMPKGNHEWGPLELGYHNSKMRIEAFIQRWETVRSLLEQAGFKDVQRHKLRFSDELVSLIRIMPRQDAEVFHEFTEQLAFFTAKK